MKDIFYQHRMIYCRRIEWLTILLLQNNNHSCSVPPFPFASFGSVSRQRDFTSTHPCPWLPKLRLPGNHPRCFRSISYHHLISAIKASYCLSNSSFCLSNSSVPGSADILWRSIYRSTAGVFLCTLCAQRVHFVCYLDVPILMIG